MKYLFDDAQVIFALILGCLLWLGIDQSQLVDFIADSLIGFGRDGDPAPTGQDSG